MEKETMNLKESWEAHMEEFGGRQGEGEINYYNLNKRIKEEEMHH